jgi:hypothetical protein
MLAALALSVLPCVALAGSAEDFLNACSGSSDAVAVTTTLEGQGWLRAETLDPVARGVLTEALVLQNADRAFAPATSAAEFTRQGKQLAQLLQGISAGILPGAALTHEAAVGLVLADPTDSGTVLRCYYAGPADQRFSDLVDQMRDYHLLQADTDLIERAPLETTTRTTRASSVIARFKPEAEALGLGANAPLSIYVLTRTTQKG